MKPENESGVLDAGSDPVPTEDDAMLASVQDRQIKAKVEELVQRTTRAQRTHLVYIDWNGAIRFVRSDSKKYERIPEQFPELVVGVYGRNMDPAQAREDIEETLRSLGLLAER